MKFPSEKVVHHDLMQCPVCLSTIRAEVHVNLKIGEGKVAADGRTVDLPVSTDMTRYHVQHHCTGPIVAADEVTA